MRIVATIIIFCIIVILSWSWRKAVKVNEQKIGYGGMWFYPTTVTVLSFVLVFTVWGELRWQSTVKKLNFVAVEISGREDVTLKCQRLGESFFYAENASGKVGWEKGDEAGTGSRIWLTYETCRTLNKWLNSSGQETGVDEAVAMHVFSHEIAHTMGRQNEAETECVALALDLAVMQKLGTSEVSVQQLISLYKEKVYPNLPSEYRKICP